MKHFLDSMASQNSDMAQRYEASMVLSGVGDAMGFKNGDWEFKFDGKVIHADCKALGGVEKLKIMLPKFRVSDDTVMHLATAEALVAKATTKDYDVEALYQEIARLYKECMGDMALRSAGLTSRGHAYALQPGRPQGYHQPFEERGGGCGAAMRAMCIGLSWPRPEDLPNLIAVSVESGRMTHHHPTGYLGSLAAALFVSYSLQGKPLREWGAGLIETLAKAQEYVKSQNRYVAENMAACHVVGKQTHHASTNPFAAFQNATQKVMTSYFVDKWTAYLKERSITTGQTEPSWPKPYGVAERDAAYKAWSFSGWGGASGHDAPMIAYDALLGAGSDWVALCERGMLHGGDNDSTGVIAGACFGAMYGYKGVPDCNHKKLEYRERLVNCARHIYKAAFPEGS